MFAGKVICEQPYVKLLTEPKLEIIELVPGWQHERYTAVAQVNSSLCVVEVKIHGEAKV